MSGPRKYFLISCKDFLGQPALIPFLIIQSLSARSKPLWLTRPVLMSIGSGTFPHGGCQVSRLATFVAMPWFTLQTLLGAYILRFMITAGYSHILYFAILTSPQVVRIGSFNLHQSAGVHREFFPRFVLRIAGELSRSTRIRGSLALSLIHI